MKLIFRDPVLYVLLLVPFIIISLLRFGLPALEAVFPALGPYRIVILATFCLVTAMFPAFIYSFIMLDEKDQDVIAVFRVLPVSSLEFLSFRLLFISVFSFVFVVLTISLTRLVSWSLARVFLVSLPVSLVAPAITLFIVGFAHNKIEGATWMKGLNFVMFLPVISYFIRGSYEYLLGILPVYWLFKIFDAGFSAMPFRINLPVAIAYHVALLFAGVAVFRRKVFR
jgi:hypothetical protein